MLFPVFDATMALPLFIADGTFSEEPSDHPAHGKGHWPMADDNGGGRDYLAARRLAEFGEKLAVFGERLGVVERTVGDSHSPRLSTLETNQEVLAAGQEEIKGLLAGQNTQTAAIVAQLAEMAQTTAHLEQGRLDNQRLIGEAVKSMALMEATVKSMDGHRRDSSRDLRAAFTGLKGDFGTLMAQVQDLQDARAQDEQRRADDAAARRQHMDEMQTRQEAANQQLRGDVLGIKRDVRTLLKYIGGPVTVGVLLMFLNQSSAPHTVKSGGLIAFAAVIALTALVFLGRYALATVRYQQARRRVARP